METDNETKGLGNSYTTEFRQYDPRLGRWLSLDPLMAQFPWMSPYVAFDNNPVYFVDPYGLSAGGPEGDPECGGGNCSNSSTEYDKGQEVVFNNESIPGSHNEHLNYKNAPVLNPYDVKLRISNDQLRDKNSDPTFEGYKYDLLSWTNRNLQKMDVHPYLYSGNSQQEEKVYMMYFNPSIKKDKDGKEYVDEKYGHYVMVQMKKETIEFKDEGSIGSYRNVKDPITGNEIKKFIYLCEINYSGIQITYDLIEKTTESIKDKISKDVLPNIPIYNSMKISQIDIVFSGVLNQDLQFDYFYNKILNNVNSTINLSVTTSEIESNCLIYSLFNYYTHYSYDRYVPRY